MKKLLRSILLPTSDADYRKLTVILLVLMLLQIANAMRGCQ